MAAAEVAAHPVEPRQRHKRPFASWVKRLTNLNKSSDGGSKKSRKASKNNPYPQSGHANYRPSDSFSTNEYTTPPTSRRHEGHEGHEGHESRNGHGSYSSIADSSAANAHDLYNSSRSRSAAPTVATNNETIHSDAGYSRALTGTTAGGALSSTDGAGANSTFSSPNQSTHSLTTTLTTIQSSNALGPPPPQSQNNTTPSSPNSQTGPAVQFTHQYPVAASAIPSHLQPPAGSQQHQPTTYASATANSLLTDNASILTLASSSKRRRRSMDTDASVRALAPHSVWGGSRESLPLSVLSGNVDGGGGREHERDSTRDLGVAAAIRPSQFSNERASVYSNPGVSSAGVSAPALASERNSFYASSHKASTFRDRDGRDGADGRSVRSIQIHNQPPTSNPSTHLTETKYAAGPGYDGASLRGYEGSIRSGALGGGHGRGDSVSGSPLHSPSLPRRPSGAISLTGASMRENSILEDREGH